MKNDLNSLKILPSIENPDIITLNILVYTLPDFFMYIYSYPNKLYN